MMFKLGGALAILNTRLTAARGDRHASQTKATEEPPRWMLALQAAQGERHWTEAEDEAF